MPHLLPKILSTRTKSLNQGFRNQKVVVKCDNPPSFVRNKLQIVQDNSKVNNIVLENLLIKTLMSNQEDTLQIVRALAAGRVWEQLLIVDSIRLQQYQDWLDLQFDMTQDFEVAHFAQGNSYGLKAVSWQANVLLPKGTKVRDILTFLETIYKDQDILQINLAGFSGAKMASILPKFVRGPQLETPVTVQILSSCWRDEHNNDWRNLVQDWYTALSAMLPKAELEDAGADKPDHLAVRFASLGNIDDLAIMSDCSGRSALAA